MIKSGMYCCWIYYLISLHPKNQQLHPNSKNFLCCGTNASEWENNYHFMNKRHDLFIEVKGLCNNHTWNEPKKHKIPGFEKDCAKLKILIDNHYCEFGVAILVDQCDKTGEYYITEKEEMLEDLKKKYSPVVPLIWQYPKII